MGEWESMNGMSCDLNSKVQISSKKLKLNFYCRRPEEKQDVDAWLGQDMYSTRYSHASLPLYHLLISSNSWN